MPTRTVITRRTNTPAAGTPPPPAENVCVICGAQIADHNLHDRYHASKDRLLTALRTILSMIRPHQGRGGLTTATGGQHSSRQ